MDGQLAEIFQRTDWDDVTRQVMAYIAQKTGRRPLPAGWEPRDVYHTAIQKLFSGERKWDAAGKPDVAIHLKGIAKSLLSDKGIYGLHANRVSNAAVMDPQDVLDEVAAPVKPGFAGDDVELAWQLLGEEVADDRDLQDLVTAIQMGAADVDGVAEMTGFDAKKIYALRRRLKAAQEIVADRMAKLEVSTRGVP